jgi:DNA-binding beta-propeller fold protein YncE
MPDEYRRAWPPSDGRPTAASDQVATGGLYRNTACCDHGGPPRSRVRRSHQAGQVGDHGLEMPRPARIPPAAIAAGLLLVALIAVGQVTSGSLPSSSTRPPGGRAARPAIPPDPPSPVVARVEVPGNPQRLAFGFGTVWVTNSNGTVSRIDPAVDQVVATIPLPRAGRRPEAIATGAGMVWVAASAGMVWRIDPARNRVVGQVDTGRLLYKPISLAVQDDAVWMVCCANAAPGRHPDGKLIRIDPVAGRVTARITVRGDPFAVAAEPGAVWVATAQGAAERVDRATNQVTAVIPAGGPLGGSQAVAVGHGGVWLADPGDSVVLRVDPATNRTVARIPVAGAHHLALDDAGVWVVSGYEAALVLVDPASNRPVATVPVRYLRDLKAVATGAGSVWTTSGTTVARIDPAGVTRRPPDE